MNLKSNRIYYIVIIILLSAIIGVLHLISTKPQAFTLNKITSLMKIDTTLIKHEEVVQEIPPPVIKRNLKDDPLLIIVNKSNGLDANYNPGENENALIKLKELIMQMQSEGLNVSNNYSGYRSYYQQQELFSNYLATFGLLETASFSAVPGFSEHQTGLAFDLINTNSSLIGESELNTQEITWLEANAHHYGFIIRYPKGKEEITGYIYEPWHLRYVGDYALEMVAQNLTLEEFLNLE
ncbi:MAG: D-alanyl-D-alanine carboxypeptidase family protein [Bacilli bacterium]